MHHGDTVVILKDKIMVGEKELSPIGILDQSRCWGRWVPDPREPDPDKYFSHLVISPFEISSWPILFRISVVLENKEKRTGTLAAVLKILKDANLNILTAEGTPAGHRHATINIIAEATEFKNGKFAAMFEAMRAMPNRLLDGKSNLDRFVHQKFIPEMLNYTWKIKKTIYDANKKNAFLRDTFVKEEFKFKKEPNHDDENIEDGRNRSGLIFNLERLETELKDIAESEYFSTMDWNKEEIINAANQQFLKAVNCTWLQNHAYYWLYGADEPKARILRYDSRRSALHPEGPWTEEYARMVSQSKNKFPFKSISTTNYTEQYIRILFSKHDRQQSTRRVKIPYNAVFPDGGDTKGLLHTFCAALAAKEISLRSVSISTEARDAEHERGTFNFLATLNEEPDSKYSEEATTKHLDKLIAAAIKKGEEELSDIAKRKEIDDIENPTKESTIKSTLLDEYTKYLAIYQNDLRTKKAANSSPTAEKSISKNTSSANGAQEPEPIDSNKKRILSRTKKLTIGKSRIIPFQAKTLFLSTKFEWLEQDRPNLLGKIQRKAEEFGFDVFIVHNNYREDKDKPDGYKPTKHLDHLFVSRESLTTNIIRGLRHANAFLQIIPKQIIIEKPDKATPEQAMSLGWLFFEYGGAQALGLPSAICVDTSGNTTSGDWRERLKIQSDKDIFAFSSGVSDSMIIEKIEGALEVLLRKVSDQQGMQDSSPNDSDF